MDKTQDSELKDLWMPIWHNKKLIVLIVLLVTGIGSIITFMTPKVYQCEALVSVPESNKLLAVSSESKGALFVLVNVGGLSPFKSKPTTVSLVNIAETKAMVNQLAKKIKTDNAGQLFMENDRENVVTIRADEIKGSDNYVKLIVQSQKSNKTAVDLAYKTVEYLKANDFIKQKIDEEITSVQESIKDTEENLLKTMRIRDDLQRSIAYKQNPNFNPAELEITINELKVKNNNLRNYLANISNYRFIELPTGQTGPVKPRIIPSILMSMVLGFMLGLLVIFAKVGIGRKQ